MADRFVATDGSDSNFGTSIGDAYATLEAAMNDGSLGAGDTVWMVVANPGEKFDSEVGTVTADKSGSDAGGGISIRATNASGVVDGTKAVMDFTGVSVGNGAIDFQTSGWFVQNLVVENVDTGTTQAGYYLFNNLDDAPLSAPGSDYGYFTFLGCGAYNCGQNGFYSNSLFPLFVQCYSAGNGSAGFQTATETNHHFYACFAEDNGGHGFNLSSDGSCFFCISNNNTNDGILNPVHAINCTLDGNGGDGISLGSEVDVRVIANNILSNNGAYGIDNTQGGNPEGTLYLNNAFQDGTNTSGNFREDRVYWEHEENTVNMSQTPYKNQEYRDFSLNNLPGGGALCRAAGRTFTNKHPNTLSFLDIGALQTKMRGIVSG